MQEVGRIGTAIDLQFGVGRLHGSRHREHPAFGRQIVAFQQVTILTGSADIFPSRCSAARFRDHMVKGQFMCPVLGATILASPAVAQEYVKSGKGRAGFWLNIFLQRDDARDFHLEAGGPDNRIVFLHDADAVEEHSLYSFLP